MGVERRRTGFRLPWAGEAEDAEGEQSEADIKVDEMTAANGSAVPASESAPESAVEASAAATGQDVPAEPTAGTGTAPADSESTDFLANLVDAMRGVAETSRDASLSELRTAIDERIDLLGKQGTEQEAELRRRADVDLEGVGEWEQGEIERIRSEAEAKRDARRRELEKQIAERRAATERQVDATRNRMADHERDLAAFFAQLGEITDPAAFVSAAKRMPRAPDLDAIAATPPPDSATDPRLMALAMPTDGDAPQAAEAEPTAAEADATTAEAEATTPEVEAATAEAEPAASTDAGPRTGAEQPVTEAAAADAHLAARLAQLDERLSGTTQPVTATTTATNGGEQSTAIVVKGLGSFGAITSFKQALERVEGVRGVTLSLGPTGEFVYRASHASEFDISAAIQSIEGPTASIEETDGILVVTLTRTR